MYFEQSFLTNICIQRPDMYFCHLAYEEEKDVSHGLDHHPWVGRMERSGMTYVTAKTFAMTVRLNQSWMEAHIWPGQETRSVGVQGLLKILYQCY